MTDPSSAFYPPHLMGVTLDSNGVGVTLVTAINRTTGETQQKSTNANKVVIFDAADFGSGYAQGDDIEFINSGGSIGNGIITITDDKGGFQELSMDCAAASTASVNL